MKKIFFAATFTLLAAACKKQDDVQTMTIVRDCTGTYLRYDNKDYHVCNLEAVNNYEDGVNVVANFKKIDKCNGSAKDMIECYMLHPNEGWIEVQYISR